MRQVLRTRAIWCLTIAISIAAGQTFAQPPTIEVNVAAIDEVDFDWDGKPKKETTPIYVATQLETLDTPTSQANTPSSDSQTLRLESTPQLKPSLSESDEKKKAEAAKKKAEALKKKVATAYKDPFYLNDFSYVNDPNYNGHHFGENLKQIPLRDGMLDIGGQYRLRYHSEHNMRGFGLTGRDDSFLLDRTRVFFNYRVNDRVRLFAEMLDAGSSYENFAPRQIEVNQLDGQNLFADVVVLDTDAGKLTARGGRQEILFGAQRLLSPLEWANTRRRFDGGRLTWNNDDRTTDFLLLRPENINPHVFDAPNQDQVLYGVYNSDKTYENPIDTYYLAFEDNTTFTRVHTIGTLLKGESGDTLWDNEFGYQFGRNGDSSDISAYAVTLGSGRKLKGSMKPTVWLYYDWASGDGSVNNGWNQLFPLAHKYLGYMDFFGRRNIHDINGQFIFSPSEKLTVLLWAHYFALSNGSQGPYNVNGSAFNPGGTVGSRDLGEEIDVTGTYKVSLRSDVCLGYSHFFAGNYYQKSTNSAAQPLFAGDADLIYAQWLYNF